MYTLTPSGMDTFLFFFKFFLFWLPLQITKYNHLGNLQYHTATHIIYSTTTVTYTTYNTIQYLHHYY